MQWIIKWRNLINITNDTSKLHFQVISKTCYIQDGTAYCLHTENQLLAFYHFINTCKYCTGLSSLGAVRTGKGEELVNVIGLEKTPLLWILEHPVCEKLLEDLSMELNKKSNILDFQWDLLRHMLDPHLSHFNNDSNDTTDGRSISACKSATN